MGQTGEPHDTSLPPRNGIEHDTARNGKTGDHRQAITIGPVNGN
jgi:hypothetical protein